MRTTTATAATLVAAAAALLAGIAAAPAAALPDPPQLTGYAANVDGPCTLERLGTQFVKCDDLTGAGVPAPGYVPEHP